MVSPCFIPGLLYIVNFQNNVLDTTNSVNPVIAIPPHFDAPGADQMWAFNAIDDNAELFQIANAATGGLLSFTQTGSDQVPLYSQATTSPDGEIFSLACNPADAASGSVIHNATGYALTAWHTEDGSDFTPVTFETYTGREEQTFFFVTIGT